MIGSGISSDEFGSSPHPQKHSPINNKNNICLTISKFTHHPLSKKPHEFILPDFERINKKSQECGA